MSLQVDDSAGISHSSSKLLYGDRVHFDEDFWFDYYDDGYDKQFEEMVAEMEAEEDAILAIQEALEVKELSKKSLRNDFTGVEYFWNGQPDRDSHRRRQEILREKNRESKFHDLRKAWYMLSRRKLAAVKQNRLPCELLEPSQYPIWEERIEEIYGYRPEPVEDPIYLDYWE